jgi:putative flavoprotein involved in K+ transport
LLQLPADLEACCGYFGGWSSRSGPDGLLEDFAARHRLPVETGVPVVNLAHAGGTAGLYRLSTPEETILTRSVVIASGASIRPCLPSPAGSLAAELTQLHSASYRNPAGLPPGAVQMTPRPAADRRSRAAKLWI